MYIMYVGINHVSMSSSFVERHMKTLELFIGYKRNVWIRMLKSGAAFDKGC